MGHPAPAAERVGGPVGGSVVEVECTPYRSLPKMRCIDQPEVVEHGVESDIRVFSGEDLKREARQLDT
eukprot:9209955-Alexandrium_andersonii.AAC.1